MSRPTPATLRPMVRVVVVNYDGDAVTRRCVDALLATHYPAERLQIVVVDNASVDGLIWVLREQYPTVTVIESHVNEGFARGCNLAMRDLDGIDYVALVNNDAIVDPDWLEPLLGGFIDPSVGAVCPKLLLNVHAHAVMFQPERTTKFVDGRTVGTLVTSVYVGDETDAAPEVRYDERFWGPEPQRPPYESGNWTKTSVASVWWPVDAAAPPSDVVVRASVHEPMTVAIGEPGHLVDQPLGRRATDIRLTLEHPVRIINSAGGGLYRGWFGGDRGFMEPDVGQYDEADEVFSWCGGAVLLSTDYLRDVGIFDSSYFLYYEDFDLSWRGRILGWRYRYEPGSVVYHEHAYSSKAGSAFFTYWVDRNRRLTLVKNAPRDEAVRAVLGAVRNTVRGLLAHTKSQLRRLRPPSPRMVRGTLRDFWSFASAVPAAVRERRRLDKRRVVSHDDIATWTVTK